MKRNHFKVVAAGILTSVLFTQPAFANCKTQADSAERAQDERNNACDSAAKPLKNKSVNEIKTGDSECKKKEKAYTNAKSYLTKCLNSTDYTKEKNKKK